MCDLGELVPLLDLTLLSVVQGVGPADNWDLSHCGQAMTGSVGGS